MSGFEFGLRTRVVFGPGSFARLGEVARDHGFRRCLVVADPGIAATGLAVTALAALHAAGVAGEVFSDFGANPTSAMVARGTAAARLLECDSLVGLGGGSSLDCAKGISFLLTNGGSMRDYQGYGKAQRPLLPMIGVPTTAGTGSEAQSYALISDDITHEKMACGDAGASFRAAILDPALTLTQPALVTATTGYDAVSHAVESYVTTSRTPFSALLAREAWRLLALNLDRVLEHPHDIDARGAMLLGAHYAGVAIEHSMLGATHACANPLTAHYDTAHGVAIGLLLPHVVRFNASAAAPLYAELLEAVGAPSHADPAVSLAALLEAVRTRAGLKDNLRDVGVAESALPDLASEAALQWTGRFNPRPFDATTALAIYRCAL